MVFHLGHGGNGLILKGEPLHDLLKFIFQVYSFLSVSRLVNIFLSNYGHSHQKRSVFSAMFKAFTYSPRRTISSLLPSLALEVVFKVVFLGRELTVTFSVRDHLQILEDRQAHHSLCK